MTAAPPIDIVELPYHRLYRAQPTYRWWRPLVALVLTAAFFFAVSLILGVALFFVLLANGTFDLTAVPTQDQLLAELSPDFARPWTLAFSLGAIVAVLPFVPLALRIAGIRPAGPRVNITNSVTFRLRMRWLFAALLVSFVVWVAAFGIQLVVGLAAGERLLPFSTDPATYAISTLVVLVLVPVQAATEEYLYRGVLQQTIGAWVRFAPIGIVVSAVAFAFSHTYGWAGLAQVGIIGVTLAVAAIRTGGLEAGIGFHAVHNIGTFLVTGTGVFGPTAGGAQDEGDWLGVVIQLATALVWLGAIELLARRLKPERLSRIGVPRAVAETVEPGIPPTIPG